MCGIFGIIGNYNRQKVELSLEKMIHRGPDGTKITEFIGGCFAQNRLAVIAPSHEFDPPFIQSNTIFVFNGELYNYKTIASSFNFDGIKSDSLCAFKAFSNNAKVFLNSAIGMFAFALYDINLNKLTLVRDRFGKKPIYYANDGSKFIFASSIDAIVPHVKTKFRNSALKSYLSYRAAITQETFYENIYKLPAGHTLTYDGKNVSIEKYFDFFAHKKNDQNLENSIISSVNLRLTTDTKIGAFLSGGLDSSTICALASNELLRQEQKLHTFCIGYNGFEQHDERYFAALTAKKINSEHTEIVFGKNDFFEQLDKTIKAFDEPISDPTSIPLYAMCSTISSLGFKSVLSGEGGDEAFSGYEKYSLFLEMLKAKKLPFASYLKGFFARHSENNREWEWYKRVFSDDIAYRTIGECFTDEQKNVLLNSKVAERDSIVLIEKFYDEFKKSGRQDYSEWMSYIDIKIWLGEVLLQKADKIGMANSLEIRCPFMDYNILANSIRLGDTRISENTKWVLKNMFGNLLPSEVVERTKKGFSYPFNKWLFDSGDPEIVFEINKQTQFFKKPYLEFLFNKAKDGSFKHQFWSVYIFSKWFASRF